MALTPGERITLIKRSAQALAEDGWSDIDLTLRTFALPWGSEDWNEFNSGGPYDFVLEKLADADDEKLVALHAHLYPDASIETATDNVGLWRDRHFRLFLSHSHVHREVAGEIRQTLLRWSVDSFVAHDMIEPTREWQDEIESALGTCDALAALLSPEFVQSKWCDQEVGFCLARGVVIVPIRFGALPHGFMGKFQALNGTDRSGWQLGLDIFRTLATHEMVGDKMLWPTIQRYVNSPNFDATREAYDLLQRIPAEKWTDEMIRAVEEDAPGNRQVAEAYPRGDSREMPRAVSEYLHNLLGRVPQGEDDIPF